jgi:undecaprenyl-diphosphatase
MPKARAQAAEQVLSGQPGAAARRWLGPLTIAAFLLFGLDTWLIAVQPLLPFDRPVELFVQSFPWGPFVYAMDFTNRLSGYLQLGLALVAIAMMFVVERRAGWLMAVGSLASVFDNVVKLSFARHRPTADLVKILDPTTGYSYPSGHAVFFTWLAFMLAAAIAPRLSVPGRVVAWSLAVLVILTACLARVWAGVHWPSDVLGGFLLGLGWSAFVLWIPERFLPAPSWSWFQRLRRKRVAA